MIAGSIDRNPEGVRVQRFKRISVLTALVTVAVHGSAVSQATLQERVDPQVKPYIDSDIVDGLAVGIVYEGRTHVFGYGTVGGGAAPDGNTVYEIGSVTKVFTGILLADAVVRGRVGLDQPVQGLLPDGVTMPERDDVPVQLVHLSTHVSGLPRMPSNFNPADANNPYADYTSALLYEFLSNHRMRRAPGVRYEYSNLAVALLGQVLALEAGTSYEQLLRERLTGPLGMKDTAIQRTPAMQKRLAPGHFADGTPSSNWDLDVFAPAGAIKSTANDMVRFIQAQLDPPDGKTGRAIEMAYAVQQQPIDGGGFAICLGWHVARDGRTRWHNGETGGYHSEVLVNRVLGVGVVVLSSTASGEVDVLAESLIRMLAGANVPPRVFTEAETVDVPLQVMERYVGRYQLMPGMEFTVTVENGNLMVGLTGQSAFRVFPRSETEWFYKVVEATITFKVDESGRCTELELFQNGVRQPARRVD